MDLDVGGVVQVLVAGDGPAAVVVGGAGHATWWQRKAEA